VIRERKRRGQSRKRTKEMLATSTAGDSSFFSFATWQGRDMCEKHTIAYGRWHTDVYGEVKWPTLVSIGRPRLPASTRRATGE
jgi:hypothetical protein